MLGNRVGVCGRHTKACRLYGGRKTATQKLRAFWVGPKGGRGNIKKGRPDKS